VTKLVISSVMSGRFEVDDAGERVSPRSSALGSVTLQFPAKDYTAICYGLTLSGMPGDQVTAIHLHKGGAKTNGAVVAQLAGADAAGQVVASAPQLNAAGWGAGSACVKADPNVVRNIRKRPSQYYVNVHSTLAPKGAARGPLSATAFLAARG
jgi:hypothetical protein